MDRSIITNLIELALEQRKNSYAPYSNYRVGAALIADDGRIFTGCNIENSSYGATNCAERTAIFSAVNSGVRKILAIAIAGGDSSEEAPLSTYAYPCGICRQVIREFSDPKEVKIFVARSTSDYKEYTLEDLLPDSFGPDFKV